MSQRRYAADHFTSSRWVASCELRRATCNPRRMPALDPLPGGQPAFCEPQSASCRPSARCTSQIAARRIDARHVRMVSTELLGLAANPRAAIREPQSASCGPVASRSSQIAARSIEARHVLRHDCSSQSTARSSQTVAQAVLFLRSQRAPRSSQGADFCAGSTDAPIFLLFPSSHVRSRHGAARNNSCRESMADPILLSQNCRPHSRRSQHFGQEVKAEVNSGSHSCSWLVARCRSLSRRGYLHEDRLHTCVGAGCMKCPRSGVVSGGLHI